MTNPPKALAGAGRDRSGSACDQEPEEPANDVQRAGNGIANTIPPSSRPKDEEMSQADLRNVIGGLGRPTAIFEIAD